MKQLIEDIVKALVDRPEEVQIKEVVGDHAHVLELRANFTKAACSAVRAKPEAAGSSSAIFALLPHPVGVPSPPFLLWARRS